MIYLDNSATTKPLQEVVDSFIQATNEFFANPSSLHQLGGQSEQLLDRARNQAAKLLHVSPDELIFTSGGTEGNNLAIKGAALEHKSRGSHIITTAIEHPSVIEAFQSLEKIGFKTTYLSVDESGRIDLKELQQAIRKDTILLSVMHVNNEIGTVQDIEAIGRIAAEYPKLLFHVDYVQGLGKLPLDFRTARIDLCTMSGHKIHGMKGTGLLYKRKGVKLFPLFDGGGQEFGVRSGTENVAGTVSFSKALRLALENEQQGVNRMNVLRNKLFQKLEQNPYVQLNTPKQHAAPHIVHFSVPGIKPEVMIHMLGEYGIYVSTKSACSSKDSRKSQVLTACGHDEERAVSGIRVSMSTLTTAEEIDTFLNIFNASVEKLKVVMK
ncbi:cysteine desulfurase family protein [Aciduricibacillus chroicocephali]|uniref:Cysteine desulfurase family protein n=1 Tax=Aciduricibacillus chroicocephali TaxID=3054939 RepID=A0ABY9KTC3_9BACI|nr:cysteine desulfurase family protein [Bacillaceae bacterium 44XB]